MKLLNWGILILGLWVLISPWALDFSALTVALWSNVISGVLIIIFALWELFGEKLPMPPVQ